MEKNFQDIIYADAVWAAGCEQPDEVFKRLLPALMPELKRYGQSKADVISFFSRNGHRPDHCNGVFPLYRFSANIHFLGCSSVALTRQLALEQFERIRQLAILPNRIFASVHARGGVTNTLWVEWDAKGNIVLQSKRDYLYLSLEFADYLDQLDIPGLEINMGSFDDDPNELISGMPILHNAHFDRDLFGHVSGSTEIQDGAPQSVLGQ